MRQRWRGTCAVTAIPADVLLRSRWLSPSRLHPSRSLPAGGRYRFRQGSNVVLNGDDGPAYTIISGLPWYGHQAAPPIQPILPATSGNYTVRVSAERLRQLHSYQRNGKSQPHRHGNCRSATSFCAGGSVAPTATSGRLHVSAGTATTSRRRRKHRPDGEYQRQL